MPSLEEGQEYKFLGVLECLKQEEKLALKCTAIERLRRISLIWWSPLSDYHRVIASTQFAIPAMSYFMWNQHWPMTELREIDREACKIVVENGGKHFCGSTSLQYLSRDKGGRGLGSIERGYKETKVKAEVKLFQNRDPVMKMVRDLEKRAESVGYHSLTKEAAKYTEEYGLQLKLQYLDLACVTEEGEVIFGEKSREERARIKTERGRMGSKMVKEIGNGTRRRGAKHWRCFWWLSKGRPCPTHTLCQVCWNYTNIFYPPDCTPFTRQV